jgi:hypothetical protein
VFIHVNSGLVAHILADGDRVRGRINSRGCGRGDQEPFPSTSSSSAILAGESPSVSSAARRRRRAARASGSGAPPRFCARRPASTSARILARTAAVSGLLFVEAAALASPANPGLAYVAGRVLMERGRTREAERWLRRATRMAAESRDEQARGLIASALQQVSGAEGA